MTAVLRHLTLREGLAVIGSRLFLLVAAIIVAPVVIAGYLALTVLILPLLGLRALARSDVNALPHPVMETFLSAARKGA